MSRGEAMRPETRTIVITGASAGVGRATVRAFAREGARIGLLARGRDGLEAAKREVAELGCEVVAISADVANAEEIENAAEEIERRLGPIDVWVNLLLLDPHLSEWLPEITLSNLRVGEASASVRFFRKENGESSYEVLDKRGPLHVVRQPSPWSLTEIFAERLLDAFVSLLPGEVSFSCRNGRP